MVSFIVTPEVQLATDPASEHVFAIIQSCITDTRQSYYLLSAQFPLSVATRANPLLRLALPLSSCIISFNNGTLHYLNPKLDKLNSKT